MNQKIENILNISLDATKEELESSESLSVGFNWQDNTWEIIVKYIGNLDDIREKYNVYIRELLFNYAIIVADKDTIELISMEPVIEYVEKPKSLYYQLERAKSAACVNNVRVRNISDVGRTSDDNMDAVDMDNIDINMDAADMDNIDINMDTAYDSDYLSGKGVIVAVIDSGIDIYSSEFRNADGGTRILNIYDQTLQKEYDSEDINTFISGYNNQNINNVSDETAIGIPGFDNIRHGTDVATIACGKSGVAYNADIIAVKMGYSYNNQFPRTTSLMDAIDYVIRKAVEYGKPVAVNISYGMNYGDHMGNTLLESYINAVASGYRCSICIGSGNEADKAIHYSNVLKQGQTDTVEISIGEYETSIDVQIWKYYWDECDIVLISPDGVQKSIVTQGRIVRTTLNNTNVISLLGEPSPYNLFQEVYISLTPVYEYITSGVWKIQLTGNDIRQGIYNVWLPSSTSLNAATGILRPVVYDTITIPSTAAGCISVGAYNSYTGSYAAFSGRGRRVDDIKPDVVAPGVDIMIRRTRYTGVSQSQGTETEYVSVTGTSYATPFVTGAAALLMEWGIVRENDRFLYGEKLKAYIRKGAIPIDRVSELPNSTTGYGRMCLARSLL